MMDRFLNGEIRIRVYKDDPNLDRLKEALSEQRWASGDRFDSKLINNYVDSYEYIDVCRTAGCIYFLEPDEPIDPNDKMYGKEFMTIEQVLGLDTIEISESDIESLFE